MRISLLLWRSLRGKHTNIFCCVWKELERVGVRASPPSGQKWATAHVAPLSPTLLCPRPMKPVSMMRPNARAPNSGKCRGHGHLDIMLHTTTAMPMANFRPIGIGQRPRWTSRRRIRYRFPIGRNLPWIPQLCMRTHPRLHRPRMRSPPLHYQRLCPRPCLRCDRLCK